MADELGRSTHQAAGDSLLDLHRVVGDEAVSTLHQLDGGLTLAHAGLAQQQHALAIYLHQHTVAGDAGSQVGFQGGNDGAHEHTGGVLAAKHRPVIFLRHLHALREGINTPGDDKGRNILAQQQLKALPPLIRRQAREVGILHLANDLEPMGIEVVKKSGKLQAGTIHVLRADSLVLIALRPAEHLQIKLFDQFAQFDGVQAFHSSSSYKGGLSPAGHFKAICFIIMRTEQSHKP